MSRKLIVLAAVIGWLFCSFQFATAQPWDGRARLIVRDNGSGIDTLTFGFAVGATGCIDGAWREQELPPPPPIGIFDARWTDPSGVQSECMGQGLRLDLREFSWGTNDTFKVQFRPGDGGYPMHFSWPPGLQTKFSSLRLTYPGNLVYVNIDMLSTTSYDLTYTHMNYFDIFASPITEVHEINSTIPSSYKLHQNFPNPFNPSTTIRFDVKQNSFIGIQVFDILGALVKDLVSQDLTPASYSVPWNGTDNSGSSVVSGVYFMRMIAQPGAPGEPGFNAIQSVVLLK